MCIADYINVKDKLTMSFNAVRVETENDNHILNLSLCMTKLTR